MPDTLIIYSSTDGHTKIICRRLTNSFKDGDKIKIVSLDEAKNYKLSDFNKIIIGASIRYGNHSKKLYKFVDLNKDVLNQKQSVFFSVNVVARKPEKNTPDTNHPAPALTPRTAPCRPRAGRRTPRTPPGCRLRCGL